MADILIVDDKANIRELIYEILKDESRYEVETAHNVKTAIEKLSSHPKVIILDIWLEGSEMDGIGLLKLIRQRLPLSQVIMISGHGNIDIAVKIMKLGAYDFIEKPFKSVKLLLVVERAIDKYLLLNANRATNHDINFENQIIGTCKSILKIIDLAKATASRTNSRIMITGASGVGKTTVAKFIHAHSTRSNKPFIKWHTRHKTHDALMAELLGNSSDRSIFLKADGGTLFINDFIAIPLSVQSMLLQILRNAYIESSNTYHNFNVRIISATTINPDEAINKGLLNNALYHNLNIIKIDIPTLEEHKEDLEPLALAFIKHFSTSYNNTVTIDKNFINQLKSYSWPGNIRQLKNTIECMMLDAHNNQAHILSTDMIPQNLINQKLIVENKHNDTLFDMSIKEAREAFELQYINKQLEKFDGNLSKAAIFMGMDRAALHRKRKLLRKKFV